MKKKLLFILPALALLLAGCNKAEQKSEPESSQSQSSETSSQSEQSSSEQSSSQESSSQEQSSSEEQSSEEQSSEESSSEEQSSEESSSSEEEDIGFAIVIGGNSTKLEENKEAELDTEHGQLYEFGGTLTNLVKNQSVAFTYDGLPINSNIGSDTEDTEHKNLVQGTVDNFYIHNDAVTSDVTLKVYETVCYFWLTGYVADTPIEDSFKLFVKSGSNPIQDFDMVQNSEKTTEYYYQGLDLSAEDEVFFCITLDGNEEWYHYSDVQNGCISLVKDSEPYIHGEEEEAKSDHNLVIKDAGKYDFYVDTAKAKDTNQAIWIEKQLDPSVEYITIYFRDASWWNNAAASTNYLSFSGEQPSGIGAMMSYIKYDEDNKFNYWYCQIPVTDTHVVFFRTGDSGTADWGARTVVIELATRGENNMYDISDTEAAWYSDGHSITGEWATYTAE